MGAAAVTLLAALLAVQVATPAPVAGPKATGDDIVVVAAREKCRLRFADRDMSDAEFRRRVALWAAGVPVRVVARRSADIKCLSKIAFKLADRGVKRIQFIAPGDLASPPAPAGGYP